MSETTPATTPNGGLIAAEGPTGIAPAYADFPGMIHEYEGIFSVHFPDGYQVEVDHNAGRVVQLTIVAAQSAP